MDETSNAGSSPVDRNGRGRVFVFKEKRKDNGRPFMFAIPENELRVVESQWGSQNVYLKVNGIEVEGSFDDLVASLGDRVDVL